MGFCGARNFPRAGILRENLPLNPALVSELVTAAAVPTILNAKVSQLISGMRVFISGKWIIVIVPEEPTAIVHVGIASRHQ